METRSNINEILKEVFVEDSLLASEFLDDGLTLIEFQDLIQNLNQDMNFDL